MPITVSFDGTRVSAAESATDGGTWDKWNASQSPSVEPDFLYQGTRCLSNKVGTNPGGVEMDQSTGTHDFTAGNGKIWLAKVNAANFVALNVKGVNGMILYIGSQNTTDQYVYHVHGSDTYPIAGGWVFIPIDPNIAGYRDATTGTPDLTAIDYFAVSCDFIATSKSENVMMDAIDFFDSGSGLTLTGNSPDGTFQDFVDFDEGTVGNRFAVVRTVEGVLLVIGVLQIGAFAVTAFTDSGKTIVFVDGLCGVGWCGCDFDLQNASTFITLTDCSFIGRGSAGGVADTRPDYTVSSSTGSLTITGGLFSNFREWATTSGASFTNVIFDAGLLIRHASGCAMDGCTFQNSTQGDNVAHIDSPDLGDFTDCIFPFIDGHAIRITVAGTYTFDGNLFTGSWGADGSSDAMIFNDSGGLVTINVGDDGTVTTFRNGAGASTVVNNNVTISMSALDPDGVGIQDVQVAVFRTSDDVQLMNEDTGVSGRATENFNHPGGVVPVYFRFRKSSTGATKRISVSGVGQITTNGLGVIVTMFEDPNVDL